MVKIVEEFVAVGLTEDGTPYSNETGEILDESFFEQIVSKLPDEDIHFLAVQQDRIGELLPIEYMKTYGVAIEREFEKRFGDIPF